MKVLKRDGRIQEFDINKIKVSISKASDDAEEPMNSSDILNISEDIEKLINKEYNNEIKYSDIRNIVMDHLNENGFKNVSEAYKMQ